jgi:ATP citrate (pro-S)-lyase
MTYPAIKTIAIIAEGVPEKRARQLLWEAKKRGVLIIGPATSAELNRDALKSETLGV